VLALGLVGGLWAVNTESGLDWARGELERFVSDRIPGRMSVGELEEIGLFRTKARSVEFFTPDDAAVILADHVDIDWDIVALLRGRVAFRRAEIDGGQVEIAVQSNGRLTIEDAFSSPSDEGTGEPTKLGLLNMHVRDLRVRLAFGGESQFVMNDVQGVVSVWRRDTPGVRVRLDRVRGSFEEPRLLARRAHIEVLHGDVWARENHVLDMDFVLGVGSGTLEGDLDYYDREDQPVRLSLDAGDGASRKMIATVVEFRSWFLDTLQVDIDLHSKPTDNE